MLASQNGTPIELVESCRVVTAKTMKDILFSQITKVVRAALIVHGFDTGYKRNMNSTVSTMDHTYSPRS